MVKTQWAFPIDWSKIHYEEVEEDDPRYITRDGYILFAERNVKTKDVNAEFLNFLKVGELLTTNKRASGLRNAFTHRLRVNKIQKSVRKTTVGQDGKTLLILE